MANYEWKPEYSVGHSMLDAQHQKLFAICDEIEHLDDTTVGFSDDFQRLLEELIGYVSTHFVDEEKILEKLNYPDIKVQQKEHSHYLNDLSAILFEAEKGKLNLPALKVFASSWISTHVFTHDIAFKEFLLANT